MHKNGKVRYLLEQGAPIFDRDGGLLYIDGVISDVTERKEAERALRESEERQRAVFENSPMAIFAKDLEGRFILFNKQMEVWLGRGREEAIGRTDYDLFPERNCRQTDRERPDRHRIGKTHGNRRGRDLRRERSYPSRHKISAF